MTAKKDIKIAIVGGGISGLTLAIALHHRNLDVTIYEQAAHFGEIGAGVAFSPNAVQAMKICHEGVYDAFEKVCTRNLWPSKQKVWFDYYDGHSAPSQKPAFTITNDLGQNGVHRAEFLDELVKLVPDGIAHFGKRLESLKENDQEQWQLQFVDGSSATADVVLGCDGIKSRVRQLMFGEDHPCAFPTYTHKYAYRALAPMKEAIEAVGEEKAQNACLHMGPSGHVLTFPVKHGDILNIVAFRTTKADWPDHDHLTRAAHREDALRDFEGFNSDVTQLLKLTKPDLDVWAIFHQGDHPVPTFAKGAVCLVGDAAHATSPHHGAGAGMCIEDAAVLSELLADERIQTQQDFKAAFSVFDAARRERGQWLVQSSQYTGDCYEWRSDGVKNDFAKIEAEIRRRNGIIADVNVEDMCNQVKSEVGKMLEN